MACYLADSTVIVMDCPQSAMQFNALLLLLLQGQVAVHAMARVCAARCCAALIQSSTTLHFNEVAPLQLHAPSTPVTHRVLLTRRPHAEGGKGGHAQGPHVKRGSCAAKAIMPAAMAQRWMGGQAACASRCVFHVYGWP